MGDKEKTYQVRVETFPRPEVGVDPLTAGYNRKIPTVFDIQDTAVERVGRLVEFDITANRKRDARNRVEKLITKILANDISEQDCYELHLKRAESD